MATSTGKDIMESTTLSPKSGKVVVGGPQVSSNVNNPPIKIDATDDDVQKFLALVSAFDFDNINLFDIIAEFEYQGFKPERTLALLLALGKLLGREMNEVLRDVHDMLLWFAVRGANTSDKSMTTKTLAKGSNRIMTLVKGYRVSPRVGGGGADVITLPRIAACFPEFLAAFLNNGIGKPVVFIKGLPDFFCIPGCASLIPEDVFNMFRLPIMDASYRTSIIFSQKNKALDGMTTTEIYTRQENFMNQARSSQFAIQNRDDKLVRLDDLSFKIAGKAGQWRGSSVKFLFGKVINMAQLPKDVVSGTTQFDETTPTHFQAVVKKYAYKNQWYVASDSV